MAGWVALEKMVMLVLLMLVGFAAAKAQWVDSAFSQKTSRLVANVFIVATILSSVVGVQPLLTGGEMAVVVAAVFVLFAIAGVLGWVCARLLPLSQGDRTAAWLSVFFMNNVFVGFPVVEALFGESAVFCASLTTLPFNLLLFSLGVSRLRAGQGQGRVTLREVFSPALVGTLAAHGDLPAPHPPACPGGGHHQNPQRRHGPPVHDRHWHLPEPGPHGPGPAGPGRPMW